MIRLDRRFARDATISWQVIEDEGVLIDRDDHEVLRLNPVGTAIWHACDGTRTCTEIVDHICQTFEVPRARAQRDVLRFLRQLARREMVTEVRDHEQAST